MTKSKILSPVIIALTFIFLINSVIAESNESVTAKMSLEKALSDIKEMQSKNISIVRVEELYKEGQAIYEERAILEQNGRKADYSAVISISKNISLIKDQAIEANDKLSIFIQDYEESEKNYNLSSMDEKYSDIIRSFKEERFEDTLILIDDGYKTLSEIESSQTAAKVFLENTSKNLINFLKKNWINILIILIVILILAIVFWKTLRKLKIKAKIYNLDLQKRILFSQIKKLQSDYFKTKTISETAYNSKTERFKEMIHDIDRQIPLLKEELLKVNKKPNKEKK